MGQRARENEAGTSRTQKNVLGKRGKTDVHNDNDDPEGTRWAKRMESEIDVGPSSSDRTTNVHGEREGGERETKKKKKLSHFI